MTAAIVGLENDYKTLKKQDRDGFEQGTDDCRGDQAGRRRL